MIFPFRNVLFREKMEVQLEKETRMLQLHAASHSYSHDSAIDADLQEWDTEMLNIDLVSRILRLCIICNALNFFKSFL